MEKIKEKSQFYIKHIKFKMLASGPNDVDFSKIPIAPLDFVII